MGHNGSVGSDDSWGVGFIHRGGIVKSAGIRQQ